MPEYIVPAIMLLAVFTQSLSGFGMGLVSMSLLPTIIDVKIASPLVASLSILVHWILAIYYRRTLDISAVKRLVVGLAIAIPLGVLALRKVPSEAVLAILGIVLVSYSLYSLFNFKLPKITSPRWAYLFGFMSGLLSGAYNTGGPPVIIYADCMGWDRAKFKSNLQSFFSVSSTIVVTTHTIQGNYNGQVLQLFLFCLPSLIIGMLAGTFVSRFINTVVFRKLILVLLLVMGLRLIYSSVF